MSWSVTVNNIQDFEGFDLDTLEFFASQHASYPRDAMYALTIAHMLGLKSATLSGGRTPNPYGGDEIVDVSVRGTPLYQDFLSEMREIIGSGPGPESAMARHFAALAKLRERPCSHIFENALSDDDPRLQRCAGCGVFLNGTMLYFEDRHEHSGTR